MIGDVRAGLAVVAFYVLPPVFAAVLVSAGYCLGWFRRGVSDDRKRSRVRGAVQRAAVASLPVQRRGEP